MKHNLKTFPKLVADSTTNEQEIIAWKQDFEKELRKRFTLVNESCHPIGTRSWLLEWRNLEEEVFGENQC